MSEQTTRAIFMLVASILTLAIVSSPAYAQVPRDADEAHAWRLLDQYTTSKEKLAALRKQKKQIKSEIANYSAGGTLGGGFALARDSALVNDLKRVNEQIEREVVRQERLEKAWDRKFWGRYGSLTASNETIYDPSTRTNKNKIAYRLEYFPYNYGKKGKANAPTTARTVRSARNNRNNQVQVVQKNRSGKRATQQGQTKGRRTVKSGKAGQGAGGKNCSDDCGKSSSGATRRGKHSMSLTPVE